MTCMVTPSCLICCLNMVVYHSFIVPILEIKTFGLKNLRRLFDKYAVVRTEHDALVKSTTKILFQILWPSQKAQTLPATLESLVPFKTKFY